MDHPLAGADLFISDLHLAAEEPGVRSIFEHFLDAHAQHAASLTINGDFLNAFAGKSQRSMPYCSGLAERMRGLAEKGVEIRFTSGNRDFMLVKHAKRFGMRGYKNEAIVQTESERIAVIHGDLFCLDDKGYLRFRKIIRAIPLHWIDAIMPASFGQWVIKKLRKKSQAKMQVVAKRELPSFWDIKDRAVIPFARRHDADVVLCGHIHQPQEREYIDESGDVAFRLLIKGDWSAESAIIACAPRGEKIALYELTRESCEPWQHEVKRVTL